MGKGGAGKEKMEGIWGAGGGGGTAPLVGTILAEALEPTIPWSLPPPALARSAEMAATIELTLAPYCRNREMETIAQGSGPSGHLSFPSRQTVSCCRISDRKPAEDAAGQLRGHLPLYVLGGTAVCCWLDCFVTTDRVTTASVSIGPCRPEQAWIEQLGADLRHSVHSPCTQAMQGISVKRWYGAMQKQGRAERAERSGR